MKKRALAAVLAAVILAGCILYMESHFGVSTLEDMNLSSEQILREMPEIKITQEDIAMGKALLSADEVKEAFQRVGGSESWRGFPIPQDKAAELLEDWIPEGYEVLELTASSHQSLYVSFVKDGQERIYYIFFVDDLYPPIKTIGVYGRTLFDEDACKAIYENHGGVISKSKFKHLWLAWLTGNEGT